jgi:ABC-type Fe3+-hydroxamate transport system substrate-binding protein
MALASEARAERERKGIAPPKVAFLEWTEPTYVGGHWTPELIEMAGGYARAYSVTPD